MCGIAGILSFGGQPVTIPELKVMTDSIVHRGPDGQGHWVAASGNVGFGHRRLSIIDLSEGGAQPMHFQDSRYTITFNGEIYNYLELKVQLETIGFQFQSSSDTEVLLALYAQYGKDCLDKIDGMFSFAIWDQKEQTLFAARDRFGEKPFFYAKHNNRFLFGSEMKELFAAGVKREVSRKQLHYYLSFNLYQDPNDASATFYNDVFQLAPAHYLVAKSDGTIESNRYWNFDTTKELSISLDDASERFDQLMRLSISRRLRSDVPVGSSLSGGLDSSTIVLLVSQMKMKGQVQKTFSARFRDFNKDEGEYIREVLNAASSVQCFETWPDGNILESLDKIWYHQEEPFGSASIVAQWSVMQLARENNVTVLLDGQGADEILGGYKTFFQPFLYKLYAERNGDFESERKALGENQGYNLAMSRSLKTMLRYPKLFTAASQVKRTLGSRAKLNSVSASFYSKSFQNEFEQIRSPFEGENNDDIKKLQTRIMERAGFTPLLRYADRNSMAHSREIRLPFLSHELVEFCIALPDQLKVHNGWTKYLLRETYKRMLPDKICWRKDKVGFEAPQKQWLETENAKEMIQSAKQTIGKLDIVAPEKKMDDWKLLMTARLLE